MDTEVTVEYWNEQTGEWFGVFQANDRNDAFEAIATFQSENRIDTGYAGRYRIVTTTTEEVS